MDPKHDLRQQIELFHLAEGFLASAVLFGLVKLGVFEFIGDGARHAAEIAAHIGSRVEHAERLLDAGVAVKLLEVGEGGAYRVVPAWAPYLARATAAGYLGNWFRFQDFWFSAFARLDQAVREGRPTLEYDALLRDRRELILAMHDHAALRGAELAQTLDTSGCATLLDVGCGPGSYAFEIAARNPSLELHLVDRPEVLEVAREIRTRYGLSNRVRYHAIDLTRDEIPRGHDLVLVSNALHVLGESASRELIARLHAAVNPGGSVVIQAQYLDDDRRGPRWPVLLDLALLCTTAQGRNHTVVETRRWMEQAGFARIERRALSVFNPNSYLRGYRD